MSKPNVTAGILSLATYEPGACHDADDIASRCETPADIIRTKPGRYQNDQILLLELAGEEGLIKDGDLVLMISAGIGYTWNAVTMRWGRAENRRDSL